jgi:hypothetical protein
MQPFFTFWRLLTLLIGGLVLTGLGAFFKISHVTPALADSSLLIGISFTLLAKALLLVLFTRWAVRVNRELRLA